MADGLLQNVLFKIIQVKVFYFPHRNTFLGGAKKKAQIHEYCKLSIHHSRILNDIELRAARKGRKPNFPESKKSTKTHDTWPFRASRGVCPLSSLQRLHNEISRVHCTLSWKTENHRDANHTIAIGIIKLCSYVSIDHKPVLVHVVARRRAGDKLLPKPKMTKYRCVTTLWFRVCHSTLNTSTHWKRVSAMCWVFIIRFHSGNTFLNISNRWIAWCLVT